MKNYRIIFFSTFVISLISILILFIFNLNNNFINILIGLMCSSIVSAIVELPSLLIYKFGLK